MALHPPLWSNRQQAGDLLAERLRVRAGQRLNNWVIALPRGGVPVAVAVAERLQCPVATWSVRKLADPQWPELAIGAIAHGGVTVWRNGQAAASREVMARQRGWLKAQQQELLRRQQLFGDPSPEALQGRHLIVVDDGIATGMTVRAALLSLRQLQPSSLTLAVPVVDRTVARALAPLLDHLEVLAMVDQLEAVGIWYETFNQLSDHEVLDLLASVAVQP